MLSCFSQEDKLFANLSRNKNSQTNSWAELFGILKEICVLKIYCALNNITFKIFLKEHIYEIIAWLFDVMIVI